MEYDYLIVGAGLFGATFAHQAHKQGKRCLVIDRREHLGGNVYCENIDGINVHKYGAHIFHTNNKEVWDFVNSIVEFNRFTESPVAFYKGKAYNLPFNYVIHTVGPIVQGQLTDEHCRLLESSYKSCLEIAVQNNVKSIAFCCISTGVFGFPQEKAAEIAVRTVREFRKTHDIQVIFNVFKEDDHEIYKRLLGRN